MRWIGTEGTRCQRTRNCFICTPELRLALIQFLYLGKTMKDGLEVSRVCKHIFQILASRCIAVSYENLYIIGMKCTLGVIAQGNLWLMRSESTWRGSVREASKRRSTAVRRIARTRLSTRSIIPLTCLSSSLAR